jgi:RNA polymerase sigma factor (sigma-70 family)
VQFAPATRRRTVIVTNFKRLPDIQLRDLDADALVTYGCAARQAGDDVASRGALAVLVYGLERSVAYRVKLAVPVDAVDEVTHDILVRAIGAAFDGTSVGQFRNWLNTIVKRGIADCHRRAGRRPKETLLPSEHDGNDEVWGAEPSSDGEAGAVEVRIIVDEVLAGFNDVHRAVIDLHVFHDLSAPEVCDRIDGMSVANVAQIASRFRRQLRDELESGGVSP